MSQPTLFLSHATMPDLKEDQSLGSGREILKGKLLDLVSGQKPWPESDRERVSLIHAIYMEPVASGRFEPFWAFAARAYYVFDVGWPVKAGGWFNYRVSQRDNQFCVGDAGFPTCADSQCEIAAFPGASPFPSYTPGELLVGFQRDIDEKTARDVVSRELPDSKIIEALWPNRSLRITCSPFDEDSQAAKIEQASEVRYAEPNFGSPSVRVGRPSMLSSSEIVGYDGFARVNPRTGQGGPNREGIPCSAARTRLTPRRRFRRSGAPPRRAGAPPTTASAAPRRP